LSNKPVRFAYLRGIPFVVLEGDGHFGRRNVVHEYPYRDDVWVEDLGRSARRFSVRGYIFGDDVVDQRARLIEAAEQAGDATLEHPTYGILQGSLLGPLSFQERWDRQRVFDISFTFILSGLQEFPTSDASTGDAVYLVADVADAAAGASFSQLTAGALARGAAVVAQAVAMASTWSRTAQRLANDATNLTNLVSELPGSFGRFTGQSTSLPGTSSGVQPGATVPTLIAQASVARGTVSLAGSALATSAAGLSAGSAGGFAGAAQGQASAVLATVSNPADAIRLLQTLAQPLTQTAVPASPIGVSIKAIQAATGDLFRRAAVVALARAAAQYQPHSVDDATALRSTVCKALDAEITTAGNQYEDAVYNSLRAVRAAVSSDLTARGAGLPSTITISTRAPMPALALAQRVYRDSSRAYAMVAQSGAVHPAFMPTSFKALT
jgi:prophage DNA circulation protein